MSTVYRAVDPDGNTVALKVLAIHLAADQTALRRFENEIKVLGKLMHPNIVRLYGADLRGNPPFLVIEHVEGEPLDKRVTRSGPIDYRAYAQILDDIARALDYAHTQDIIHRDVKPSNILIRRSDGLCKLTDFGVAKSPELTAFTATHARVGSAYYMSPEQVEGALELTPACDIYSLGVTSYLALTGRHPFEGGNEIAIARQHLETRPVHVSDVNPSVPRVVGDTIQKALEKLTYRRHASAGVFADAYRIAVADVAAGRVSNAASPRRDSGSGEDRLPSAATAAAAAAPTRDASLEAATRAAAVPNSPRAATPVAAPPAPVVIAAPRRPARRSNWMLAATAATFAVLCCLLGLVGVLIARNIGLGIGSPLPFGQGASQPFQPFPYPTPLATIWPTVTPVWRSIADDLNDAATTMFATVQPDPSRVETILLVTPTAPTPGASAPAPTVTPHVLRPTATLRPRPIPPVVPRYPTPPLIAPPPPPPPPLGSPLVIITSAP